jgi:NAD(P)-dependent dehydrogenase (short-subunit alcohol dehydrogenase family)
MTENTTRRDVMTAGALAVGAATVAGPAAAQRSPARAAAGTRPTAAPLSGRADPNGRFAGKTLVVTGGTSGFGRAVAEEVARQGGYVAFNGRREALGKQVEAGIRALGGQADFTSVNVQDRPGMKRWIDGVAQRRGGLDLLHANAGIAQRASPTAELDEAHWDEMWRTNVSGMFYAVKDSIPHMLRRGGGSIVMTGSAFGHRGQPQLAAYNANKYAVHGMMRSIALELGPQNIRVNAVAPGAVPTTDFGRGAGAPTPEGVAMGNSNHGIGRMGETMEVAKAVVWLMTDEASFVAGEVFAVDGAFRVG